MLMESITERLHVPRLVERLIEGGILRQGAEGLETTATWRDGLLRVFMERRDAPMRASMEAALAGRFPQMEAADLNQMAHIMFFVEARETGAVAL